MMSKADSMYVLVLSTKLDGFAVEKYTKALPGSSLIQKTASFALFHTCFIERGRRGHIYDLSCFYGYSHLFFSNHSKCFHEYGLLVSDMDSTLISIECIDVLAIYQGVAEEVSRLTAQAMENQDVDYRASLLRRVALLQGFSAKKLPDIYDQYVRLTPGAQALMAEAHKADMYTVIASGGFDYFTERLCKQLGMSGHIGNTLEVVDGLLTGRLLGDFVDADFKAQTLLQLCRDKGLATHQTIAIGDGANDLGMMQAAGLAVGFRPKPVVGKYVDAVLFDGLDDLPRMLHIGKDLIKGVL